MKMKDIVNAHNNIVDIKGEIAGFLAGIEEAKKMGDGKRVAYLEKKFQQSLTMMSLSNSIAYVWDGVPIICDPDFSDEGMMYFPVGTDSPNRSVLVDVDSENPEIHFIVGADRNGISCFFMTFSTTKMATIDIVRNWIVNERRPGNI